MPDRRPRRKPIIRASAAAAERLEAAPADWREWWQRGGEPELRCILMTASDPLGIEALFDRGDTCGVQFSFGRVSVTEQVLAYQRKKVSDPSVIDRQYDGHPGGGITRQVFLRFESLVADAHRLIFECGGGRRCPSCVQTPMCGNLNEPLAKAGAVELLARMLEP